MEAIKFVEKARQVQKERKKENVALNQLVSCKVGVGGDWESITT